MAVMRINENVNINDNVNVYNDVCINNMANNVNEMQSKNVKCVMLVLL